MKSRLHEIIRDKSLRRGESFKLSSGRVSNYYFDMKLTTLDPEGANLIADAILSRIASEPVDAIGGLVLGAVPIVATICANSYRTSRPIPAFFVRKEPNGYGTNQLIDGNINAGMRVILVDDVTTTGGSVLLAVKAVREAECLVDKVITVVDRLEGAADNLRQENVALISLYTRANFEN